MQALTAGLARGRRARVGGFDPGVRTQLENKEAKEQDKSWEVETVGFQDLDRAESILREHGIERRSGSSRH